MDSLLNRGLNFNNVGRLPENVVLAAFDVSALYTNIPQDEGLDIVENKLEANSEIPTGLIRRLLGIILKFNFFEFNQQLIKQEIGTAMGAKLAPDFANIFMANIDKLITKISSTFGDGTFPLRMFKRFLDDIFTIFCGTLENLHEFHKEINNLHPNIKFTLEHTSPQFPIDGQTEILPCGCVPK